MKNLVATVFTTSLKPSKTIFFILHDLKSIFPNSIYFKRNKYKMRQIISYLKLKKTKNLIVILEHIEKTIQFWHFDLEHNFLAKYSLISIILKNNIQRSGRISSHNPELLFDKFTDSIGRVIGVMMKNFFYTLPNFEGRQILSFYKRKNFLFIRYYRYVFSNSGKDVRLQEIGPKITLKFENFFQIK